MAEPHPKVEETVHGMPMFSASDLDYSRAEIAVNSRRSPVRGSLAYSSIEVGGRQRLRLE